MKFDINKITEDAKDLGLEVLDTEENAGKLQYRNSKGVLVEFDAIELLKAKPVEIRKTNTRTMTSKEVMDRLKRDVQKG